MKLVQAAFLALLLASNQLIAPASGGSGMLGEPAPSLTPLSSDDYRAAVSAGQQPSSSSSSQELAITQQQQPVDRQAVSDPNTVDETRSTSRFFKAILLGPLVGLTLKAALIRGLVWAVSAYMMHLFAPALLSTLGLGTGLVGFARQMQPDYLQIMLTNLNGTSLNRLVSQYRQLLQPVVLAIESIPEGHCRFRAVCEVATNVIRGARGLSTTIQRLSAVLYTNLGSEYSRAWLDGVVQKDCATRYNQCESSPFQMVLSRLAESVRQNGLPGLPVPPPVGGASGQPTARQPPTPQATGASVGGGAASTR